MIQLILMSAKNVPCFFSKHVTFGAITTLEGRRFQMSTIQIEKNHFLMLKFACCTNSLKLCPLFVEKLPLKNIVTLLS